ncbi:papain family cysteine protease domain-containing protein [Phthorimaea operculella]|nr:papain family cysteine protease domain-containing protein [Phthorimaea operculella]
MRAALIVVAVCAIVNETSAVRNGIRSRRSYDRWLEVLSQLSKRSGANGNSLTAFPIEFPFPEKDGSFSALPLLVLPFPIPVPDRSSKGECSANHHDYDVRLGNSEFAKHEIVTMPAPVSSAYLIEVFRNQQPESPGLPPAVIGPPPLIVHPTIPASRGYLPPQRDAEPTPPKFDRSMVLHAFLKVFKAGYTEQYTVRFDAKTGAARVEYHEGATVCYRMTMSNGRVRWSSMHTDRTSGQDSVVCGVTTPQKSEPENGQAPGLPNTEGFTFAGYKQEYGGQAEVWKRDIQGGPGKLGAAQGESLVYHHELLVHRRDDGFVIPLRYTVHIDSSVLGPQCDGYEHIYSSYEEKEHSDDEFRFSERQCDVKETLDPKNKEHMARLDPIREYTSLTRATVHDEAFTNRLRCSLDPKNKEHMARLDPIREYTSLTRATVHDEAFTKFSKEYERTYADSMEEALRKNLLTQKNRYIASCNRQGATFSVGHNFLSDRLDDEISEILGVTFSAESENNTLSFSSETAGSGTGGAGGAGGKKLPQEWDWRPKGAVSSVKFQGAACSSCWAFAVTGSVEGALFIRTKKLVELSVQALVDCSKSHGAHGCNKIGTWPVHAYNYVKDKGLPAVGDYAAYDEKDHECKAPPSEPTTHIEGGVDIPPNDIDALKTAIRYEAPAVLVVDAQAKSFISYKSGVLKDDRCKKGPKKKLNHAVLTVGWGEQNGEPHFIIKNSWSAAWGEAGKGPKKLNHAVLTVGWGEQNGEPHFIIKNSWSAAWGEAGKGPKKLNHAVLTVGWGEQNGEPHFIIKNSWSAAWGEAGKGPKEKLNHAVLTVGWGEQNGEPHFIIKNSWSAAWSEAGYVR